MTDITAVFRRIFASLLAFFLLMGITSSHPSYTVTDASRTKLSFSVISDAHMESNNASRRKLFIQALQGIKADSSGNDALVMCGDNTMNGQEIEELFLYGLLEAVKPADQFVIAAGNHELGNSDTSADYAALRSRFISFYNNFTGSSISQLYYYKVINGAYFIVLGSDEGETDEALSDTQLTFLDETLAKASSSGMPTFVINHEPPQNIYKGSDKYVSIIKKYKNVFVFDGHDHIRVGDGTFSDWTDSVHEVNLPCLTASEYAQSNCMPEDVLGVGLVVEVTDNTVNIRVRSFAQDKWYDSYSHLYTLAG